MRKPSEIIELAVNDERYDPMFTRWDSEKFEYLCNLLDAMMSHDEITEEEWRAAKWEIRKALRGTSTLSTYIVMFEGRAKLVAATYYEFWRKLIKRLQSAGL